MCNQDIMIVLVKRDFLKLRGLLAADALPRPQRGDVAGFTVITNPIKLAVMNGVKVVDLEIAVRAHPSFQANLVIAEPLIFQRVEDVLIAACQRVILGGGLKNRPSPGNENKLALEDLTVWLFRRPQRHGSREQERHTQHDTCKACKKPAGC